MKKNSPYSIGFSIEYNKKKYRIATLNFIEQEEFFYHFSYIKKGEANVILNENIEMKAGMVDHISFHKDGTIYVTHKKYKGKKYRYKTHQLNKNLFNIIPYDFYPLLMESFYFEKTFDETLPEYSQYNSKEANVNYLLEKVRDFSIVLFFCKSVDASMGLSVYNSELKRNVLIQPGQKQMQIWFKKFNLANFEDQTQKKNLMFEAFNGWWIVPIFTKYVLKKVPPEKIPIKNAFGKRVWKLFPDERIFLQNAFNKMFEKSEK